MAKLHTAAYTRTRGLIDYGTEVENEIVKLQTLIEKDADLRQRYGARWLAVKLLEEDEEIAAKLQESGNHASLLAQAETSIAHLRTVYGDDVDTIIADRRYGWIHGLVKESVQRTVEERMSLSDKIDRIVTNRVLGIPIFLVAMWIVFKMTIDVSGPYLDWLDGVIGGPVTTWIVALLGWLGLGETWFESLMVDGVVAGVGGVLVFVPVLLFLYLFLALLEDSGYMARAAFVMDRLMHVLGLHGKSFLPMLVGFGCTVPAIYATRTLENEDDRKLTGFLVPMMSCGARLPVYTLFAAAFFAANAGRFVFALYITGIVLAIVTGMVMKRTLYKGKPSAPFVMELPPYRLPTWRGVWTHMWERTSAFVTRAFTIIMISSIVIWALLAIPIRSGSAFGDVAVEDSLFAGVAGVLAPVFKPAGFGTWQASGSLVTGFIAKEVVVGTMSQIYVGEEEAEEAAEPTTFLQDVGEIVTSFVTATVDTVKAAISVIPGVDLMGGEEEEAEDTALMRALRDAFTPLQAVAFNVFVLLYVPCMVAVAAQRQEYGTRWTLFNAGYLTALGWVAAVLITQVGGLLGLG
jgi:ferrous iron transport protein B